MAVMVSIGGVMEGSLAPVELVRNTVSGPSPDPLNHNLQFNEKSPGDSHIYYLCRVDVFICCGRGADVEQIQIKRKFPGLWVISKFIRNTSQ